MNMQPVTLAQIAEQMQQALQYSERARTQQTLKRGLVLVLSCTATTWTLAMGRAGETPPSDDEVTTCLREFKVSPAFTLRTERESKNGYSIVRVIWVRGQQLSLFDLEVRA